MLRFIYSSLVKLLREIRIPDKKDFPTILIYCYWHFLFLNFKKIKYIIFVPSISIYISHNQFSNTSYISVFFCCI